MALAVDAAATRVRRRAYLLQMFLPSMVATLPRPVEFVASSAAEVYDPPKSEPKLESIARTNYSSWAQSLWHMRLRFPIGRFSQAC